MIRRMAARARKVLSGDGARDDIALWRDLIAEARRSELSSSTIHGEHHWRAVAATGLHISMLRADVSPRIVLAFGIVHDCRRWNDDEDPDHGDRASEMVLESLAANRLFETVDLHFLAAACRGHTHEKRTTCGTIGACWDADRFNLSRLDIKPDAQFMSCRWSPGEMVDLTNYARRMQHEKPSFESLLASRNYKAACQTYDAVRCV